MAATVTELRFGILRYLAKASASLLGNGARLTWIVCAIAIEAVEDTVLLGALFGKPSPKTLRLQCGTLDFENLVTLNSLLSKAVD